MNELARPMCAAAALFVDADGDVLIVEPTDAPRWEIPGGAVDLGETPRQACVRALDEGFGLDIVLGRLLVVDWAPLVHEERVRFIFDGGSLTEPQLDAIDMPPGPIDCWAFIPPAELFVMTSPRTTRRVTAALGALAAGQTWYLENGLVDRHAT